MMPFVVYRGPGSGCGGHRLPARWSGVEHQQRLRGRAWQPSQQLQRWGLLQRQRAAPARHSGDGQAAGLQPLNHCSQSASSFIQARPDVVSPRPPSPNPTSLQDWPSWLESAHWFPFRLQHLRHPPHVRSTQLASIFQVSPALHQSNEWDLEDTPAAPSVSPSVLQKHNFQPENVTTQCPTASFFYASRAMGSTYEISPLLHRNMHTLTLHWCPMRQSSPQSYDTDDQSNICAGDFALQMLL